MTLFAVLVPETTFGKNNPHKVPSSSRLKFALVVYNDLKVFEGNSGLNT